MGARRKESLPVQGFQQPDNRRRICQRDVNVAPRVGRYQLLRLSNIARVLHDACEFDAHASTARFRAVADRERRFVRTRDFLHDREPEAAAVAA